MKNQKRATLFALIAVGLWSTVASAFKLSLQHMTVVELLLGASFSSLIILGTVLIYRGQLKVTFNFSNNSWKLSLGLGLINPFLYYLVLFKAYELLPAQEAQAINYSWALSLSLLSVLILGQKLERRDIIGLLLAYVGIFIISTKGEGFRVSNLLGVTLALTSTILWSLYWIFGIKDKRDPISSLFLNFLFGTSFIFLYYLYLGEFRTIPALALLGAVYVGAFEMSLTFVFWMYALKLSRNTAQIGSLIFLSPFVSLILIHFLLKEAIQTSTIIGLVLIIIGLSVQKWKTSNKKKPMSARS